MSSRFELKLTLIALLVVTAGTLLSGCQVEQGPTAPGLVSHGSLGSTNMADYYYHKDAGWVYVFQNVQHMLDHQGNVMATFTGANDTVFTMGYDGVAAPNGDSLFRIEIHYRVLSAYANRDTLHVEYFKNNTNNGGFLPVGMSMPGSTVMRNPRPRPISTDTIVAGLAGYIRTQTDDFTNPSQVGFSWLTDTLWWTAHNDSVFIWERLIPGGPIVQSRMVFCKDFTNSSKWTYDLVQQSTVFDVLSPDQTVTVPAGTFPHCVKINVYTSKVSDDIPITEIKWFACGTGSVKQYDQWRITGDGMNYQDEDFVRSLISVTKH